MQAFGDDIWYVRLHHLFVADALARWKRAAFHAPASLAAKRPDLPAARPLNASDAAE